MDAAKVGAMLESYPGGPGQVGERVSAGNIL